MMYLRLKLFDKLNINSRITSIGSFVKKIEKHGIISSNLDLMRLIKKIDNMDEKNSGSFNIYLKSKNKFR